MTNDIKSLTNTECREAFLDERQKYYVTANQQLLPTEDTIEDRPAASSRLKELVDEMKRRGIPLPT